MGDIKKTFGVDSDKEQKGVWQDITEDIRVKVARIGNPLYQKELNRLLKPHRMAIRRDTIQDAVVEKCVIDAMAKTILLDWEGIEEDGKPVPYSYENAKRLLTEYKEFREQVSEIANGMEAFRLVQDEESEKNSEKSSSGP